MNMFSFLGNTLRSDRSATKESLPSTDENAMMVSTKGQSATVVSSSSSTSGRRVLGEITNNINKPTTKRRAAAKKAAASISRSSASSRSTSTRSQTTSRAVANVSETHSGVSFGGRTSHAHGLQQRVTRRRIVRKGETQLRLQQQKEEAARRAAAAKLAAQEAAEAAEAAAAAAAAAAAQAEMDGPDDVSMLDTSLEDIDAEDRDYPEYCSEYVKEIFEHLREKEVRDHIGCGGLYALCEYV
jgi:hypothetical protein